MAKQIILGTAGHIDHGKSSLVLTLTGIDPDRLKEEKARGITIELGFAHMTLPDGRRIGIVDVPGHEKFVRHMVAGATGVDIVALVIAADEGVMPQTREHLEICQLLGIGYGLVVLTKIDLVEPDWLGMVAEDVREFVKGTFLEGAPINNFSAHTGKGMEDVVRTIMDLARKVEERQAGSIFRMPLDRVFTMKGFGTVVTGTTLSGRLSVGDTVMVYPGSLTAKVRGLQVHNDSVTEVEAGQRSAVNLQGLERDSVERGQVLAPLETLHSSRRLDVWVQYLSSQEKPLKNRVQIRFHVGTSETLGRLLLLDREELAPGESGPAQVLLENEAVCLAGDRFVLRSYSPMRTIAGGEVLNPLAPRRKRFNDQTLADLTILKQRDPVDSIQVLIDSAGAIGTSARDLAGLIDLPGKQIKTALDRILSRRTAIAYDKEQGRVIGGKTYDQLKARVTEILNEFHRQYPVRPGLVKEELKTRVPGLADVKLLVFLLDRMVAGGEIVLEREIVRLASHQPNLAQDLKNIQDHLIRIFEESALTPPYLKEIASSLPGSPAQHKEVIEHLVKTGVLVKIKSDLFFHKEAIERLWSSIKTLIQADGELTMPQFKEATGLSRKYLIPILEYFDARGLTMRVGDKRFLRTEKS
ncbi:MAG: selenocysteine-specific translation elongation factor [Deltaproteobacteria bacterium]|nr:selenocysteine-specific translation elongation factor [Deltaproteobacteria bacterium]